MVIGWICSRDLLETSWEGLHDVLSIVIAEESRMFACVLSLPQWRCFRNFERLVSHTNVHAGCGRSWRSGAVFGWDDSHYYAHTEATYTGIMPVLSLLLSLLSASADDDHDHDDDHDLLHFRGLPFLPRRFPETASGSHGDQPLATKDGQLAASLFQISLSGVWPGSAPLGSFHQIQRWGQRE